MKLFTNQKLLTSAFLKARDQISNRQRQQLAFISEFTTDITHVPGSTNVVPDELSRQYDDEAAAALVHSVTHTFSDVDLQKLVELQLPLDGEPTSSLQLQHVNFPGVRKPVVCDVSTGRPRILVPETYRRHIFDRVHGMAHPSGLSTLTMVARDEKRGAAMGQSVFRVWNMQGCTSNASTRGANRHAHPTIRPGTCRFGWAISTGSRFHSSVNHDL